MLEVEEVDYNVYKDCTPFVHDIEWDPKLESLQRGGLPDHPPEAVAPPPNGGGGGGGENLPAPDAIQDNPPPNGGAVLENGDQPQVGADSVAEPFAGGPEPEAEALAPPVPAGEPDGDGEDLPPPQLVNPIKRKRGRPRKSPSVTSMPAEISSRRPRGRPPKSNSRENPKPHRRPRRRNINKADFQLPPGWVEAPRKRKSGNSAGHVDMYYIEVSTGQRCRSRVQVLNYISAQQRNQAQA